MKTSGKNNRRRAHRPASKPTQTEDEQLFRKVGECLYRHTSGKYYALVKRGGKQFRRSLKTKDRRLAERKLSELRHQVGALRIDEDRNSDFESLAKHWLALRQHGLSKSTVKLQLYFIENLTPYFPGAVRNVKSEDVDRWLLERGQGLASQTFNHELEVLRGAFDYAVERGLLLANPVAAIKRRRVVSKTIQVPSRQQFDRLVSTLHESYSNAQAGYLVELMAYSGCRPNEAASLRCCDIDLAGQRMTVNGTKTESARRTIPMTPAMAALAKRLKEKRADAKPHDRGDEWTSLLSAQLSSPVRWKQCLQTLSSLGVTDLARYGTGSPSASGTSRRS